MHFFDTELAETFVRRFGDVAVELGYETMGGAAAIPATREYPERKPEALATSNV